MKAPAATKLHPIKIGRDELDRNHEDKVDSNEINLIYSYVLNVLYLLKAHL